MVIGSKYPIDLDTASRPRRILINCGMFRGQKKLRLLNWSRFPVPPSSASDILLTRAHMDYAGHLPRPVGKGFNGAIWRTGSILALTEIISRDSAFLQEHDTGSANACGSSHHVNTQPLCRIGDVERTPPMSRTIEFARPLDLEGGMEAAWTRARRILGSGSIHLSTPNGSILFSGNLGRATHPVLRQREVPEGTDLVLVESTCGDREHPDPIGPTYEAFAEAIRSTVDLGDNILIPAFVVDHTEVVLLALDKMLCEGRIPDVPVFVDSPMTLSSLEIYRTRSQVDELCEEAGGLRLSHLDLHGVRSVDESKALNTFDRPVTIISTSGMASRGRILHHLERMLPGKNNCIILTDYQAIRAQGRSLLDGATSVKMRGMGVAMRCRVVRGEEFSVHADASELSDWAGALKPAPRQVFCVHGEDNSARALAELLGEKLSLAAIPVRTNQNVDVRAMISEANLPA